MGRRAFTLVELLVVVAIVMALAAITLYFLPSRAAKNCDEAASQLQVALGQARSMAVRDHAATGVRLLSSSGQGFDSYQFVQLPPNLVIAADEIPLPPDKKTVFALLPDPTPAQQANPYSVPYTFEFRQLDAPGDPFGPHHAYAPPEMPAPGDRFECVETPAPAVLVTAVSGGTVTLAHRPDWAAVTGGRLWQNYRFLRDVAPLMGDPVHQLPVGAVVLPRSSSAPGSRNLPTDASGNTQIVFAPGGNPVAAPGLIVLWVADLNGKAAPTLLAVYPTGSSAAHPQGPAGDPYRFCRDGRSSGK